jgi:hypothetical protein
MRCRCIITDQPSLGCKAVRRANPDSSKQGRREGHCAGGPSRNRPRAETRLLPHEVWAEGKARPSRLSAAAPRAGRGLCAETGPSEPLVLDLDQPRNTGSL